MTHFVRLLLTTVMVLGLGQPAHAVFEDPTGSQPFLPWLWDDQLEPTFETAIQPSELATFASGIAATIVSHQYDPQVRDEYGDNRHLPPSMTKWGAIIGSGMPGISIAVLQLFLDQKNGLQHARALALTSATAISIATIAHRERPNHSDYLSFPSGHTSSAFTTATTLAYEYGWWAGIPAYGLAGFVAASRISDNDHWFSDTVSAAALGFFWARASALAHVQSGPGTTISLQPMYVPGGALAVFTKSF